MPYKNKEEQKAAQKLHYQLNKDKYRDSQRRMREKLRTFVREYKSNIGCECGEKRAACLDFHHVDRATKSFEIADGIALHKYSIPKLEEEIKKCVVICANCHRVKHDKEKEKFVSGG